MIRRAFIVSMFMLMICTTVSVAGTPVLFNSPTDDRWHYPFNSFPGTAPFGKTFGTVGSRSPSGDRWFNERDGMLIIAWDTSAQIVPGQGASSYHVKALKVILTSDGGATWESDLTEDEWFTYDLNADTIVNADGIPRGEPGDTDGESDDEDPGRPFELFGAGFSSGAPFDETTWNEFSFYIGWNQQMTPVARNPFPFVYQDGTLEKLHVEDNVAGFHNDGLAVPVFEFTPKPWATGLPIGYVPGNTPDPFELEFSVDLDLSCGEVRRYFEEQLDRGRIIVTVTSLFETVQQPGDIIPLFYQNTGTPGENPHPARLEIVLSDHPLGDIDGNDILDPADIAAFIAVLLDPGGSSVDQQDRSDLDCSGAVNGLDISPFVRAYLGGC